MKFIFFVQWILFLDWTSRYSMVISCYILFDLEFYGKKFFVALQFNSFGLLLLISGAIIVFFSFILVTSLLTQRIYLPIALGSNWCLKSLLQRFLINCLPIFDLATSIVLQALHSLAFDFPALREPIYSAITQVLTDWILHTVPSLLSFLWLRISLLSKLFENQLLHKLWLETLNGT